MTYEVLFTFQLVSLVILLFLIIHIYKVLRDARGAAGEGMPNGVQKSVTEMINELHRAAGRINQDFAANSAVLKRQLNEAESAIVLLDDTIRRTTAALNEARTAAEKASAAAANAEKAAERAAE